MGKKCSGILRLGWIVLGAGTLALSAADEAIDLRHYVHPLALIEPCPENRRVPGALTTGQALAEAVRMFGEMGVKRVCVCEVRWLGTPVSGYLVDAQGDLEMTISHGSLGEEGRYSIFRLGVADRPQGDGSRFAGEAGGEFVFIAKGVGPDGKPKWFPPAVLTDVVAERLRGDPQGEADIKFPLVYFVKYFRDQERFASLAERYAPCGPAGKQAPGQRE